MICRIIDFEFYYENKLFDNSRLSIKSYFIKNLRSIFVLL